MSVVDIHVYEQNLILRGSSSELLILSSYVQELKKRLEPQGFSEFFMTEALVNRSARKLFESWVKKDTSLWPRLFKTVMSLDLTKEPESKEDSPLKSPVLSAQPNKKLNSHASQPKRSLDGVKQTQKKTRKKV